MFEAFKSELENGSTLAEFPYTIPLPVLLDLGGASPLFVYDAARLGKMDRETKDQFNREAVRYAAAIAPDGRMKGIMVLAEQTTLMPEGETKRAVLTYIADICRQYSGICEDLRRVFDAVLSFAQGVDDEMFAESVMMSLPVATARFDFIEHWLRVMGA